LFRFGRGRDEREQQECGGEAGRFEGHGSWHFLSGVRGADVGEFVQECD
jgi:hypothetical protein